MFPDYMKRRSPCPVLFVEPAAGIYQHQTGFFHNLEGQLIAFKSELKSRQARVSYEVSMDDKGIL